MHLRFLAPIAVIVLVFALAVAGCGDDDGDDSSATPTVDTSASPSGSDPAETDEPGNGETPGDEKTPGTEETPGPGETTDPNTGPSATPGHGGTPAVAPADQAGFLGQFGGANIENAECTYDPATLIAGCGAHGDFSVDPPLTGQDVSCQAGIVDEVPVYVSCQSQIPLTTIYYEILS